MQITMIQQQGFLKNEFCRQLFIVFLLGTISLRVQAQNKKEERSADIHYHLSEFNQALPIYLSLLKQEPTSFLYNYRAGMCYLNSNIETSKCVTYFEKAKLNMDPVKDSTADFYYYLGHAYQIINKFDPAIECLSLSKSMLDRSEDSLNIFFINSEIEQCKRGKVFMANPSKAKLFNLGKTVNSKYPDYSPVIMSNEKVLFYTSTRKGSTAAKFHKQDEYYEDIYISKNKWSDSADISNVESSNYQPDFLRIDFDTATNAGKMINTQYHDASISVAPDSDTLYLFRSNAVWKAGYINGSLSKPEKLDYIVDGKVIHKSSLTTSADKKTLYFVSDQKGGIGGKDIYRSYKQLDGSWGPEENLGPIINTTADEEAPYFDSNENLLYFSSQGHNTIGGFDVYRTKFDNEVWSTPENMGYPINSGTDDVFYSINSQTNKGYISTMREEGVGNYDIYLVRFLKPLNVLFATTYAEDLKPLTGAASIISVKTGDSVSIGYNKIGDVKYKSLEKFIMTVPHYDNDSVVDSFEFTTPESYGDFSNYQEVNYQPLKNNKNQLIGYKTTLYNAFFDIEKKVKSLTAEEQNTSAYSGLVKKLSAENEFFKVFSKSHLIDTSIYPVYTEVMTSRALAAGNNDPIKIPKTPQEAKDLLAALNVDPGAAVVQTRVKTKAGAAPGTPAKMIPVPSAMDPILFSLARYSLNKKGKEQFDRLYDYLVSHKELAIKIVGYTDAKGSNRLNKELAVKRAIEIKLLLIKKGIDAKRLKAIGRGSENPASPNNNDEGRKLNRRVEFEIM